LRLLSHSDLIFAFFMSISTDLEESINVTKISMILDIFKVCDDTKLLILLKIETGLEIEMFIKTSAIKDLPTTRTNNFRFRNKRILYDVKYV